MDFNDHANLKDQHAFLSPSKYHWINYDEEKLINTYRKYLAVQKGTQLHQLACDCINLGVKLPKSRKTLNMYVNDAIGYKMQTEQLLYYSNNCFGTADTISFRKNFLRIHDLKTGESRTSMNQLMVYNALFCLEYKTKPTEIETELRIYQHDDVLVHIPEPEEIEFIIDKILEFDKQIDQIKIGG